MNKEQKKIIRKFERWQDRRFASNAKKGYRFFQPDTVATPTPRTAREAWGSDYRNGHRDDNQERLMTFTIYAFMFAYVAFIIWKELP
jgi:hypothetical protein